jgi:hypothetical protein
MKPIDKIRPGKASDRLSFERLAQKAQEFLRSQKWCMGIRRGFLDIGWEGILAVFFFEIEPASPDVDDSVWVIVGDLPSAYICNDSPNGPSALEGYVWEMKRWVRAVRKGKPVTELIPVNVPPTKEYADMLGSRLKFIEKELLSQFKDQIIKDPVE